MSTQSSQDLPENTAQTLFQQMHECDWFARLLAQVKTWQSLQATFDKECPLELMGQCRVLGVREACLTIEVNNASLATQLRYRTRELIIALRQYPEFKDLKKIRARVSRSA